MEPASSVGLKGGLNFYGYVDNDPANWTDATGLHKFDKLFGLPRKFWNWAHRQDKGKDGPDYTEDEAMELFQEWNRLGKPRPDNKRQHRPPIDIDDILDFFFPPVLIDLCQLDPMLCGGGAPPQCM